MPRLMVPGLYLTVQLRPMEGIDGTSSAARRTRLVKARARDMMIEFGMRLFMKGSVVEKDGYLRRSVFRLVIVTPVQGFDTEIVACVDMEGMFDWVVDSVR